MAFSQDSWIFSKEYIEELNTTEVINNVVGKRKEYISKTIWLMEDIGKHLNFERKVIATAAVYFHRFFMFHSFNDQKRLPSAIACLFLASKAEEKPIKLRELIAGFDKMYRKPQGPDFHKQVLLAERILLNTLGFELNYTHPLACVGKIKDLRAYCTEETVKRIYQSAVNFINDSYRSSLCLQYSSAELGLALIFLATCQVDVPPTAMNSRVAPESSWLDIMSRDVKEETICDICLQMLELYEQEAYLFAVHSNTVPDMSVLRKATCDQLGVPSRSSDDVSTQPPSPSPSHVDTDMDDYDKRYSEERAELAKKANVTSTFSAPDAHAGGDQAFQNTPINYSETPVYLFKQETPSSTPGFSTPAVFKRRERSYSESEGSLGPEKVPRVY